MENKIKDYENMRCHVCPVHGVVCTSPQHPHGTNSNFSFNSEELNNQIYQLETQITFLENKIWDLNKQKNDEKINNKKLNNLKKERYTKA